MACPVCSGERIPQDCSVVEKQGKRVIIQGRVYAIIPANYTYSPFRNYLTVVLYPRPWRSGDKVKYLKFKTQLELDHWPFEQDASFIIHGCLHIADGKELVFDVTQVEPVSS